MGSKCSLRLTVWRCGRLWEGVGGEVWPGRMLPLLECWLAHFQQKGLHHLNVTRLWIKSCMSQVFCDHTGGWDSYVSPAMVAFLQGLTALATFLPQDLCTGCTLRHTSLHPPTSVGVALTILLNLEATLFFVLLLHDFSYCALYTLTHLVLNSQRYFSP